MLTLLKNPAQIITVNTKGKNEKRGAELSRLYVIEESSLLIENDTVKDIIPNNSIKNSTDFFIIDVSGKAVMPGLVECHTHTAFAGSRANEFREKIAGKSYEEIAKTGGGINATVQAIRKTSKEDLIKIIKPRINHFISQGITTLEIKSGYGLDFENELKLLEVINDLKIIYPINIIPTFLGAHTFPPEHKDNHEIYINEIINKMLPEISSKKLADFCDGFCETGAFSSQEIDRIFSKASSVGMKLRLHTDQFNSIGGLETALKYNANSVDHLEILAEEKIDLLSNSNTAAVLLPGVSFFLNYNYAPARKLIDNNALVALSTDYNPGSSYISNLNFIMSLAALKMKMKIEETISAVTINAAKVLNLNYKTGSIELNKQADIAVFDTNDYSDIVYSIGNNLNMLTIKGGKVIYDRDGIIK